MSIDWKFLRWVALTYVGLTAATIAVLSAAKAEEFDRSVVAGSIVSIVNFILGFLSVEYAFEKSHTEFLKIVLGGMAGRLLAMAVVVLLLVKVYDYDSLSLMLALLGYYAVNLALEIGFLQKKVSLKNTMSST